MIERRTIEAQDLAGKLPHWKELRQEAYRLGLSGTKVFKLLDDETIEREFNYIGPDRMPKWFRVFLSKHHISVLPAVLIHDLDFVIGGNEEEFHRANKRLKNNMMTCLKANRKEFTLLGYMLAKVRVRIAYRLCEWFGWSGWTCPGKYN